MNFNLKDFAKIAKIIDSTKENKLFYKNFYGLLLLYKQKTTTFAPQNISNSKQNKFYDFSKNDFKQNFCLLMWGSFNNKL